MAFDNQHPLDNPIWSALTTYQERFAATHHCARRFQVEVSPLAALAAPAQEHYDALAEISSAGEVIALFLQETTIEPAGWTLIEGVPLLQMVQAGSELPVTDCDLQELTSKDVPEMLALARLTMPGPFGTRQIELGTYLGIRNAGELVAMAGERLRFPGHTEISAVCTHPAHAGRGYAAILISTLLKQVRGRGEVPFLHVRPANTRAVALYKRLGFVERRELRLTFLRKS